MYRFLSLVHFLWIFTAVPSPVFKKTGSQQGRHLGFCVFTRAAESTEQQTQSHHFSVPVPRGAGDQTSLQETEPTRKHSSERGSLRATAKRVDATAARQEADASPAFENQTKNVRPFTIEPAEGGRGEEGPGAESRREQLSPPEQQIGASSRQPSRNDEQKDTLLAGSEPVEEATDAFDSNERSKPPEVNVSQVWVQDSPQDYIDEGSPGDMLETAHIRAITASLEGLKDWLLRRINDLDTDVLSQQQIRSTTQQWAAELQELISVSPCVSRWEKELA